MSKPIIKPREELNDEEVQNLHRVDKERYFERYILKLLQLNKETGISANDVYRQVQQWTSKPTLLKMLETLLAKRQLYKTKVGKSDIYFPNGRPLHPLVNETITIGDKKYKFQLLENPEGLNIYIQEIKREFFGIEETVGGIMIPFERIHTIAKLLTDLTSNRPKLIEQFKLAKMDEWDKKLEVTENEEPI